MPWARCAPRRPNRSRPPAASARATRSSPSTRSASTPSSGWPSTPARSRSTIRPSSPRRPDSDAMITRAALPGRLFPPRQSRRRWPAALTLALASLAGCSRQSDVPFRVDNARVHLDRLTDAGPRPTGSAANAAARAYLVDQLRLYGFDVRTQTVDASRPEYGRTMRVTNIVATRAGSRQDAIALVAHYDSVPIAPGAMDDGIGTAVALEAARLLAAPPALRHTLVVLLTDGEEFG